MNEYEIKLANVKKSCDVARKVAKVLSVIMVIFATFFVVSGIGFIVCRGIVNECMTIEVDKNFNGETIMHVMQIIDSNGTTNELFEFSNSYGVLIGTTYLMKHFIGKEMYAEAFGVGFISLGVTIAIIAGIFIIIMKVFKLIQNSDTPFGVDIMKRLKSVFIIITVYTFFSEGLGSAVLTGAVFWSVYCILDYGYVLQKESDETL